MKKILVCPLDWGLGHATRCIPVIEECQRQGAEVLVASSGRALALLRSEYPGLTSFELPEYRPVYPTSSSMVLKMATQVPRFIRTANQEHQIIERLVKEHSINYIISDNRFGCWSAHVPSVFITHQVNIKLPSSIEWLSFVVDYLNHSFINRFQRIWVPDVPGSGLTDSFMSADHKNVTYIGWLSRLKPTTPRNSTYRVMGIISGPEPQREIFERMVVKQLSEAGIHSLIVAGEPDQSYRRQEGSVEIVSHLSSSEMEKAIVSADLIISRCGYSTLMDLMTVGAKAAFVPTPQQPEQLFFAKHLREKGIAFSLEQHEFSVTLMQKEATRYAGFYTMNTSHDLLVNAINDLLR
ncbi:MAG: hypothetical protein K2U26_00655 [Cyclobacteriaceae bacterium]|nr:hypothetical protein [Cyclobacteriaceae bacterium]